jgi:hypothetical protein
MLAYYPYISVTCFSTHDFPILYRSVFWPSASKTSRYGVKPNARHNSSFVFFFLVT